MKKVHSPFRLGPRKWKHWRKTGQSSRSRRGDCQLWKRALLIIKKITIIFINVRISAYLFEYNIAAIRHRVIDDPFPKSARKLRTKILGKSDEYCPTMCFRLASVNCGGPYSAHLPYILFFSVQQHDTILTMHHPQCIVPSREAVTRVQDNVDSTMFK